MSRSQPSLLESPAGPWLNDILNQLAQVARMPDGWDGHGSPALQAAAMQTSIRLVLELALDEPTPPRVCPVPGGGVQLEWQTGGRELELEILPDGSVQYLKVEGEEMLEGDISTSRLSETRPLIWWLKQG